MFPSPSLAPRSVGAQPRPLLLCLLIASAFAPARAQEATTSTTVAQVVPLENVTVKGQGMDGKRAPYSSTTLDAQQIRDAAVSQPEQLLRKVPGVEVRNYSLGGVANVITIRGFSGGAHGGDLGMVIDGIPLNEAMSHADGYADLNVIVPLEIDSFQVFRGPVSALYGNFNRGGVIAIDSRRGGEYALFDASVGSFRTADVQAAVGRKIGPGTFNGAAQLFGTKDFRPDSKYVRGNLTGRYSLNVGDAGEVSVSVRAHQGEFDSASYLPKTQSDAGDPYGKDPRVRNDGGDKHFYTGRVDYNLRLSDTLKLLTFAYTTSQDFTRFYTRPVTPTAWSQREESYKRSVYGLGFSLNGKQMLAGAPLNWVAGVEAYRESTDYVFFEGTQARQRVSPAAYDREYAFDSQSGFFEGEWALSPWLRPTLGVRYDRFTGDCTRSGTETGTDPCSTLNEVDRTTPKFGVRSTVATGVELRASAAEGFALPPNAAKYAPGGANLKPTVFRQVEAGGTWTTSMLRVDLAAYRITSSNEVRTVSPGVYENFGHTRRKGIEAAVTLTPVEAVELGVNYTRMKAVVTENITPSLVGKLVTGVPRTSTTLTAAYRPVAGFGFTAEGHRVADSAVDAANTLFAGAYTTFDLGAQYVGKSGGLGYRAYLRVDNVADRVYATNVFLSQGQVLLAPGAPRSIKVGVQLDL